MSELKNCPFCGGRAMSMHEHDMPNLPIVVWCDCEHLKNTDYFYVNDWNTRADGWISVHDKKPKYGTPVILSVNNVVQDITYNLDGGDDSLDWFEPYSSVGLYDDLKDISLFVTHDIDVKWMSLPNPPARK